MGTLGAQKKTEAIYLRYKKAIEYAKFYMFNPAALNVVSFLILITELMLNIIIVHRVPYTEIDWTAYMQECEGFLNGTTNYALLKGDTGPLVYPAVFVYIYSGLFYVTLSGRNIRLAQYIFIGIYICQMWLVLRLYTKSRKIPPYVLVISVFTSYRIHSIYVLRLFNDPVAILLLYASLNLFLDGHWTFGSTCFSLAVGVKMNILLFAPALFLFYITNLGFWKAFQQIVLCGLLQLVVGAPFLISHPIEYLKGSFDLGRIFQHKWTVNYRFLPEAIFENRLFHLGLLFLHLLLIVVFSKPTIVFFRNYARLRILQQKLQPLNEKKEILTKSLKKSKKNTKSSIETESVQEKAFLRSFEKMLQNSTNTRKSSFTFDQCTQLALLPFFLCNFLGILCARSLHYQFYVWYFHSLPYLTWSTEYRLSTRFLILGLIEFCWNVYPSTIYSSCLLHLMHFILLYGIGSKFFKTTKQSLVLSKQL